MEDVDEDDVPDCHGSGSVRGHTPRRRRLTAIQDGRHKAGVLFATSQLPCIHAPVERLRTIAQVRCTCSCRLRGEYTRWISIISFWMSGTVVSTSARTRHTGQTYRSRPLRRCSAARGRSSLYSRQIGRLNRAKSGCRTDDLGWSSLPALSFERSRSALLSKRIKVALLSSLLRQTVSQSSIESYCASTLSVRIRAQPTCNEGRTSLFTDLSSDSLWLKPLMGQRNIIAFTAHRQSLPRRRAETKLTILKIRRPRS